MEWKYFPKMEKEQWLKYLKGGLSRSQLVDRGNSAITSQMMTFGYVGEPPNSGPGTQTQKY